MKVEGPTSARTNAVRRAGRSGSAAGSEFAKALSSETESASAAGPSSPVGGVNPLFALQEVDDAAGRKAKARQRGEDILDQLDQIRIGLLEGRLSVSQIQNMARMVRARRESVDDPRLAALLDEIDLRAQVELAKLGA